MKQSPRPPAGLWAITSYFNPMGYRTRSVNYGIFLRHLKMQRVPLLTVEQGHRGRFELTSEDATCLVQVPSEDVMWQKECLLNLALRSLPADCDKVVWLDSDILFEEDDWPRRAAAALENATLIQLFSRAYYLPKNVDFSQPLAPQAYLRRRSTASGLVEGAVESNPFGASENAIRAHGMASDFSNGHAWIMRRDLLEQTGFYDAMIVGGGDYLFLQAAIGKFDAVRHGHGWTAPSSPQYRHFMRWARSFHEIVKSRIGMVPGDIYNLWHGELLNRRYLPRHAILTEHDFDPDRDIVIDEHGCLRWNSDKPALHEAVRDYFMSRQEDGAGRDV